MVGTASVRMDFSGEVRIRFSNQEEALRMLFPEEHRLHVLESVDHDLDSGIISDDPAEDRIPTAAELRKEQKLLTWRAKANDFLSRRKRVSGRYASSHRHEDPHKISIRRERESVRSI